MRLTFSASSPSSSSSSLDLRKSRLSAYIFCLLAFAFIFFFAAILYGEDFVYIFILGNSENNPLRQPISTINESTCPSCLNSYSYTNSTGKGKKWCEAVNVVLKIFPQKKKKIEGVNRKFLINFYAHFMFDLIISTVFKLWSIRVHDFVIMVLGVGNVTPVKPKFSMLSFVFCFGLRKEQGKASVCFMGDEGRVWCFQWEMGQGRVDSAALQRIWMSLHSAAVDVSRSWQAWPRLSALEVAASRLWSSQVRAYLWLPLF